MNQVCNKETIIKLNKSNILKLLLNYKQTFSNNGCSWFFMQFLQQTHSSSFFIIRHLPHSHHTGGSILPSISSCISSPLVVGAFLTKILQSVGAYFAIPAKSSVIWPLSRLLQTSYKKETIKSFMLTISLKLLTYVHEKRQLCFQFLHFF